MNRRAFLASGLALTGLGSAGWHLWPEAGVSNPCRTGLPPELAEHPLLREIWRGLDPTEVWDMHAHLAGDGDSGSGIRANPEMDSLFHPWKYLQKRSYLNAACVENTPGRVDASYVERLDALLADFPAGARILLFAFDWAHDDQGRPLKERSAFYVPDAHVAQVAQARPARMEWVASIHPYRPDALDTLEKAAATGARGMKWLPAAMNIDPADRRCDAFYRSLARHGLPLISHAGHEAAVAGTARQDLGNPLKLRRALDAGVKVVVAHCASDGEDLDERGRPQASFALFARMLDEGHANLYGDISAVTQFNRISALETLLRRSDWHGRLLNGSDYPLPGIPPLISLDRLIRLKLLAPETRPFLNTLRQYNPLLFDLALKRLLRLEGRGFAASVFETRPLFERKRA